VLLFVPLLVEMRASRLLKKLRAVLNFPEITESEGFGIGNEGDLL